MARTQKPRLLAEAWFHRPENREWKDKGFRNTYLWIPGGYEARKCLKRFVRDGLSEQEREEWLEIPIYNNGHHNDLLNVIVKSVRGKIVNKLAKNAKGKVGEPNAASKTRVLGRAEK